MIYAHIFMFEGKYYITYRFQGSKFENEKDAKDLDNKLVYTFFEESNLVELLNQQIKNWVDANNIKEIINFPGVDYSALPSDEKCIEELRLEVNRITRLLEIERQHNLCLAAEKKNEEEVRKTAEAIMQDYERDANYLREKNEALEECLVHQNKTLQEAYELGFIPREYVDILADEYLKISDSPPHGYRLH